MEEILTELDVEWERSGESSFVVTLPGVHKLKTLCNLIVEDHALRVEAFVVRHPEENHERVWRLLLRRNAELYGVSFAVDADGDIYLIGRVPLASITTAEIDRLLGAVLTYADEIFDVVLEQGFRTSIQREWRWRLSRGESTRNLAAFTHLKPADPD